MLDHAKCSVCGGDPYFWASCPQTDFEHQIYGVDCRTSGCADGPERETADAAWDAWDKLHGPRIPDAVKEIVLSAWATIGAGERWCHATLKEAVEECPQELLLACGCGPGPNEDVDQ